jgi:hypothetical protein
MRAFTFACSLICCFVSLSEAAFAAGEQHQKPILEQETLHAIPASFAEMWRSADVVAKVAIIRSDVHAIPGPVGAVPRIQTLHRATVRKVLKGGLTSGSSISFTQVAGELDLGTVIVRVTDEEPLAAGDYIVFLQKTPNDPYLHLVGDVDGAYKVTHGYIEPQGRFTAFAKEHRGLSERRFVEEIEAVAARSPKVR